MSFLYYPLLLVEIILMNLAARATDNHQYHCQNQTKGVNLF